MTTWKIGSVVASLEGEGYPQTGKPASGGPSRGVPRVALGNPGMMMMPGYQPQLSMADGPGSMTPGISISRFRPGETVAEKIGAAEVPVIPAMKAKKFLQPGDILLAHNVNPEKRNIGNTVIEIAQRTPYAHAALYLGDGRIAHMLPSGAHEMRLKDFNKDYEYQVVRPKATEAAKKDAIEFASKVVTEGREYDMINNLRGWLPSHTKGTTTASRRKEDRKADAFNCGGLVAASYAGIPFAGGKKAVQVLPMDLSVSPKTELIGVVKSSSKTKTAEEDFKTQGSIEFQGLKITVENKKGSVRQGVDSDGKKWRTKMKVPYGFFNGTKGADGEEVDVFVGPDKEAKNAYVVHQHKVDGKGYDEDKVILGCTSKEDAIKLYLAHYSDKKFLGPVKEVSMGRLKAMFDTGRLLKKIAAAAAEMEEKPLTDSDVVVPASTLGGVAALQSSKPLITGRTRFYHGTAKANVPGILENGLRPAGANAKGITEVLGDDIREKAKNLSYLTDKKNDGRYYYHQAEALKPLIDRGASREEIIKATKEFQGDEVKQLGRLNPFDNKGIVEMDLPMWRQDVAAKKVPNPEARGTFEEFKKHLGIHGILTPEEQLRAVHKSLSDSTVMEGGVDPEFIRGSSKFKGVGLNEIGQYTKAKPKDFAKGVGLAGLGALGVGYGAHEAYKHLKPMLAEPPQPTPETAKISSVVSPWFYQMLKLATVSEEDARRALDQYESLQKNQATPGQVARYAGLGAVTYPAIIAGANLIKGKPNASASLLSHVLGANRPGNEALARAVGGNMVIGSLQGGAVPLLRQQLDRGAQLGTLKKYISEHVSEVPTAATPPSAPVEAAKVGSIATTPQGIFTASRRIGLPKVSAPSGPSISQVSKPVGFGKPAAGATKSV